MQGASAVGGGTGVEGISTSVSDGFGVRAEARSPVGRAVRAVNEATTGNAIGVEGVTRSSTGRGVLGVATEWLNPVRSDTFGRGKLCYLRIGFGRRRRCFDCGKLKPRCFFLIDLKPTLQQDDPRMGLRDLNADIQSISRPNRAAKSCILDAGDDRDGRVQ